MIKILHVDGDSGYLRTVKEKLSSLGPDLVIETAENYAEAVAKIENKTFDIILTESRLPFSNGINLIETIRDKDREIPIILLSSETGEKIVTEALRAGANDYFSKDAIPQLSELFTAITGAVRLKNRRVKEQSLMLARQAIAEETALITNKEFFNTLLKYIALNLDVNFAFVGELSEDSKLINTVSVWGFGHQVDNFSFPITGTTSEAVLGKKTCVFTDNVLEMYPLDNTLQEMGIKSFIGCPLYDHTGAPIGIIAAMDNKPFARPDIARSLLATLSTRASVELERLLGRRSAAEAPDLIADKSRRSKGIPTYPIPYYRSVAIEIFDSTYLDRLKNILTESRSTTVNRLLESARKIAQTDLSVLVTGEIGTNKDLLAAYIHQHSYRSANYFIKVECFKYNSTSLEKELFGTQESSLKSSDISSTGLLGYANGGTVLFNNIHKLEKNLQARLIKFIKESGIKNKRGKLPVTIDIRVIATTDKSLRELVGRNKFDEELYQELKSVVLEVPALRERLEDLPTLTNYFLEIVKRIHPDFPDAVSDNVLTAFSECSWPGNVRQLESVVNFASSVCAGEIIEIEDIPQQVMAEKAGGEKDTSVFPILPLKELERMAILTTIEHFGGNKSKAARSLGISDRKLFYKLKEYEKESK